MTPAEKAERLQREHVEASQKFLTVAGPLIEAFQAALEDAKRARRRYGKGSAKARAAGDRAFAALHAFDPTQDTDVGRACIEWEKTQAAIVCHALGAESKHSTPEN